MAARNGETDSAHSPFGWVEVQRADLRVHPNWANNGDINFDYGAIILPLTAPLGTQTGFFGYGHFLDQDLDESAPTLSGYPDDVPEGTQSDKLTIIEKRLNTRPGDCNNPGDDKKAACSAIAAMYDDYDAIKSPYMARLIQPSSLHLLKGRAAGLYPSIKNSSPTQRRSVTYEMKRQTLTRPAPELQTSIRH